MKIQAVFSSWLSGLGGQSTDSHYPLKKRTVQNDSAHQSSIRHDADDSVLDEWRGSTTRFVMAMVWVGVIYAGSVGLDTAHAWLDKPVQEIRLQGALQYVQAEQLHRLVESAVQGSFMELDMVSVKQRLETEPWVDEVRVRRLWPAGLKVAVEEEVPVARWGEQALLNRRGDIFRPGSLALFQSLPLLNGPQGSALELMKQFRAISHLLRPLDLKIAALSMENRGAWTLTLANGIEVIIGRRRVIEKLSRFSRIYQQQLASQADRIRRVDIRYTNGVAVSWKDKQQSPQV
jgi:cell division protein FtsQ